MAIDQEQNATVMSEKREKTEETHKFHAHIAERQRETTSQIDLCYSGAVLGGNGTLFT